MASFKPSFQPRVLSLLLAAALGGACSINLEADANFSANAGDQEDNAASSMPLPPPTTEDPLKPPPPAPPTAKTSFADLCGGGCMTGDQAIGCTTAMNPESTSQISCQIVSRETGASAECLPAGTSQIGEACEDAGDCAASLGCVRQASGVGVCRPYCCGDVEACESGSYCASATMNEDAAMLSPTQIPVCVPGTQCKLLDDTSCTGGLTCTLVRGDGTTDCVTPGEGKLGDGCPCAAGFVCAKSLNKCVALCHVDGSDCPDGMVCQGGSKGFQTGIGVCVK